MAARILIVDDSATVRQQTSLLLRNAGYEVSMASNGTEGVERAKAGDYELMIVDINMPGMNGIEMIAAVRALPKYASIPIFVLSTESSKEMAAKGKKAGATAWMVKPFKPPIMLKAVEQVLAAMAKKAG